MKVEEVQILEFEPTSHCNAKCAHCPRFNITHHEVFKSDGTLHPDLTLNHIDVDAVIKNLELHRMPLLKTIVIQGDKGDPCMHPKIDQLVAGLASAPSRPHITLTTNGSIRNINWWSKLAQIKNLEVVFSIDGLADTNHLYRVGLDYATILKNAQAFIAAGGSAIWKMIVFRHNQHQIDEIKTLAKELGFAEFRLEPAQPRFKGMSQWPVEVDGQVHYLSDTTLNIRSQQFKFKNKLNIVNSTQFDNVNRVCPNLVKGRIYITHQNYIIPCCMMHFDTELKYFGTEQLKELTEGFERHDISKFSLSTIFEQPFFKNKLVDSFKSGNLQYTCEKSCKSDIEQNLKELI
jgi:sulfatase maturation enzyme AslB (radical SAM superfamily)